MNKDNFEELYENYTHMMLFVSSNKLKLENNQREIDEIKKAYIEISDNENIQYSLNSLKGLKTRLNEIREEIKAILYQYREIDHMIHQVDIIIADYAELDIEIDLYELNGIENDLLGIKDENTRFNDLNSQLDLLNQCIDEKISELKN